MKPLNCVHELFEAQVRRAPNSVSVELDGNTLTYQALNERANRLAHYLRRAGVGPDVLVGVSMERSLDLIVAIYAILKAGGAYVPLDPAYPQDRLHFMVGTAKLKFLVSHSACSDRFSHIADCKILLVDQLHSDLESESKENPVSVATGDHLIYVIFTSGSTGQPKAAAVYHRGFTNLMQWFVEEFNVNHDDHALLISSLSFDLTQKNLFATLICGGTLHLYPPGPFDLSVLSRLICDRGITLLNCTPSVFYPLIDPFEDKQASSLASLRIVFLGGEPISISRIRPWISHPLCIADVANTYGPTECTDICGFYRLTRDNLDQYDFVPLGRAITNVQMAIVHSDGRLCETDEAGELCVGGAGVGAGYINDAELTREKFITNTLPEVSSGLLYRTGDQARRHQDGVIEFLGRLDHQVKIRGYRIELPEIERTMERHPCVQEAIVIVKNDQTSRNPQLVGCFTLKSCQSLALPDLRSHLTEKLPGHMIPSTLLEYPAFPLSPNGKVDRKALAKLVQESLDDSAEKTILTGAGLEDQILAAWSQVLDGRQAGLNDNFFDTGGDSLRLARLHQILESLLGREFPITDLFAHPTIHGMSQHLGGQATSDVKSLSVRDRARLQREAQAARRRTRV